MRLLCRELLTVLLMAGAGQGVADTNGPQTIQTASLLEVVESCLRRPECKWCEEWRAEYSRHVCEAVWRYDKIPDYCVRMQSVRAGFLAFWRGTAAALAVDRTGFETAKAQVRWYIETWMKGELPSAEDVLKLRAQVDELLGHAVDSLQGECPFLTHAVIDAASGDCEAAIDAVIDSILAALLPGGLTDAQMVQIRDRWDRAYTFRMALWRQMSLRVYTHDGRLDGGDAANSPYYLFAHRCLDMVLDHVQQVAVRLPDYLVQAIGRKDRAGRGDTDRAFDALERERRLWPGGNTTLEQIEQWGFAVASLLASTTAKSDASASESRGSASSQERR